MARNYQFAPEEYYHIYARGFEKLPVFRGDDDYWAFIERLYLLNTPERINIRDVKQELSRGLTSGEASGSAEIFSVRPKASLVDIGAYCLMPNHFHILVREKQNSGISKFMQKLMTSYTMYFNKRHERTGAIFGSSYKAQHVLDDQYLRYLFAYIHMNPRKIISSLRKYQYSSYLDYCGVDRPQRTILAKGAFPDYFEGAHEQEVERWLSSDSP